MYIRVHLFIYAPTPVCRCNVSRIKASIMDISANVLAQIRKNCAPEISGSQKEIINFVERNGGKIRANFWAVFNDAYSLAHDVIVCVGANRKVTVLPVRHDRIFARHVGELLKTSKLMWGNIEVTWKNWKAVYAYLTASKDAQVYDYEMSEDEQERYAVERKREEMFYEQASNDRYKKMGKRGYNLSFNEMRAVRRMEAAERQAYRTIKSARQMMEAM